MIGLEPEERSSHDLPSLDHESRPAKHREERGDDAFDDDEYEDWLFL